MTYACKISGLAVALALISAASTFSQTATDPQANTTSTTAAHVYIQIQGTAGAVYGFNSSSTGQISVISGSPFKPAGEIVGSTPTKFFTLGQTLIHSFGVASNGAIGSQLAQIPILDYTGSSCDGGLKGDDDAALDHTGKYVYVMLDNNGGTCAAYQSYIINSDGSFSFDGDTVQSWSDGTSSDATVPSILGNEKFAYAQYSYLDSGPVVIGFRRESSGTLELMQFNENYPALNDDYYVSGNPDASPAGSYLVLQLWPSGGGPRQLASYSVDSAGNLSTTNTASNMPASSFAAPSMTFSPTGNLLAVYEDGAEGDGKGGIELYHFNGASPLTLYKKLLTGTYIDQVAWDSTNHLYAISTAENKLYVFTVTTTAVTQDTSWSIGAPFKMVVVSSSSAAGSPATQYSDPLINQSGTTTTVGGQVTIDTSGNTTVTVTGQESDKTYTLQFCPAYLGGNTPPACFNITTVSTDSSGAGNSKAMFPKSGDWAGEFLINNSSGTVVIASGLFPNVSNETYLSTLLPESKVNGGVLTTDKTQDPLSNGSVTYSNNTLLFTVNGANPSTSYQLNETNETALYSSDTYGIGSFTTNGSGNGSASADLATAGSDDGDMLNIEGGSGAGFIGGFSIP